MDSGRKEQEKSANCRIARMGKEFTKAANSARFPSFSRKINWYRINKRYKQALILLYCRVERKINRIIHDQPITVSNIVAAITRKKAILSQKM